ncbi:MAG: CHRD domain-containing protein [Rhodospirillales bacterium]|nr:CHRD domain-containing protein [Rhodospirillales bacterium]
MNREMPMTSFLSRRGLILGAAIGLLAGAPLAQAKPMTVTIPLTGAAQVPPVTTAGHGSARITYDAATHKLSWSVSYSGLGSPVTMAHFHNGGAGKNGPVVLWISKKGGKVKSPLTGSATLTPMQAKLLMGGDLYVNVHTKNHPAGAIRGQVKM